MGLPYSVSPKTDENRVLSCAWACCPTDHYEELGSTCPSGIALQNEGQSLLTNVAQLQLFGVSQVPETAAGIFSCIYVVNYFELY